MTAPKAPKGLTRAGAKLWRDIAGAHDLGPAELVTLEEMCRVKGRLDELHSASQSDEGILRLVEVDHEDPAEGLKVVVNGAISEARQQANIFKQLHASLRLPDAETGAKPQARGGARGAYKPRTDSGKVSSLARAREARARGA